MDCIFCKIIDGKIPATKVFEDTKHIAFMDIHPMHKGHVLVIPKKHADYIFSLPDAEYSSLLLIAKKVAPAVQKATNCKKVAVAVEGISISHVHVHLIPVNEINDLDPCKSEKMSLEEISIVANKIKSFL